MDLTSDVSNQDSNPSSPPQSITTLLILSNQSECPTTANSSSDRSIINPVKNSYTRSASSKGLSLSCDVHKVSSSPYVIRLKSTIGKSTFVCDMGCALLHVNSPSCSRHPSRATN